MDVVGDMSGVRVELHRGRTLRGRVVDEAGHPVEDASVRLHVSDQLFSGITTSTNASGRFAVAASESAGQRLFVTSSRHAPALLYDVTPSDEERIITLTRGGSIEVQVVADALPRSQLTLTLTNEHGVDLMMVGAIFIDVFRELQRTGTCLVEHVPQGTYNLEVRAGGQTTNKTVSVKEEQQTRVVLAF